MAANNPRHKENLKKMKKGFDERRNLSGRPRKYISEIKDSGYKLSEIHGCLQVMLSMTLEELKQVYDSPQATVLEKIVANALVTSLKGGKLDAVETILSRIFSAPKNISDVSVATTITVTPIDKETAIAIENI